MNIQDLIEEYKRTIDNLQKENDEKTNIIIALGEQLSRALCGECKN